nr:MAG TPA: hypothetical protein [Caudoviricetes sp.]
MRLRILVVLPLRWIARVGALFAERCRMTSEFLRQVLLGTVRVPLRLPRSHQVCHLV